MFHFHHTAAFTVALALAAGMVGQAIASHMRLPGIVVLLVFGVLLGPDVANLVQPQLLGDGLPALVGFAVAIILFEGGMNLDIRRVRHGEKPIRKLITIGALVSLVVGMGLAMVVMGWEWQRSLLFGTLVIVTGPTVVTPLLRRLNVQHSVSTVLEAEGVLIDAVGAITAAVALELVVSPTGSEAAMALPVIFGRLLFGTVMGFVGGLVISLPLRFRGVIPEGYETVFTLGMAVAVFESSNAFIHESGIAAVTVAGLVVGNFHVRSHHEIVEFKEQLTVMLIGMLFVLLVADVRIDDVMALGWRGGVVAAGSIILVRPLSVAAATFNTRLTTKERIFVGWIGPRGIVAAAVASIFGFELAAAGIEGGTALRSLVFLVIAVTVVWSALTGGIMARVLGLRRKSGAGWIVLGGNPLARLLARELQSNGCEVVAIDNDPDNVGAYEQAGVRAIKGNALEQSVHEQAELDTRAGAIAATTNEDVNYLFGEKARLNHRNIRYPIVLTRWDEGVTEGMVDDFGGEVMCGSAVKVSAWAERIDAEGATLEWFRFEGNRKSPSFFTPTDADPPYVALIRRRKKTVEPVTGRTQVRKGDAIAFLIHEERRPQAEKALSICGMRPRG
jgi:NhaP-type Na+/H+ or K+/H+ antiporter